jgi:glycosyltransferase involved in cell wall biosynthesis
MAVLGLEPGLKRPWDISGIRRYLREVRPQIVHTFLLTASLYGRLAAILEGVPIVIGTEVNIYERKRRHHAWAERLLMKRTNRVVVSAESVRDFYIRQVHADPAKVDVIYNAVDFAQAQPTRSRIDVRRDCGVPADGVVGGIIARLTEQKGHRFLFDAMASTPELADMHMLVIGGGDLQAALVRQVEDRGLSNRVHFLGPRRDLGDLLAAIDLFVMPSLWEGLPLSLVLAMGAGLPVVATRVAGIPEVVDDGRTGLLVAPADVAALGSALASLVNDGAKRERMGRDSRASVLPRFNVDGYVQSTVGLYDRLLAEQQADRARA